MHVELPNSGRDSQVIPSLCTLHRAGFDHEKDLKIFFWDTKAKHISALP